jgi:branched-chain amino acid transport system substrate-binding protein
MRERSNRSWAVPRSKAGLIAPVIAVVMAVGVAACGSSSTSSSPAQPSASSAAASGSSKLTSTDVQVVAKYLGLKASGKATGSPIQIGAVSGDSGPQSDPTQALAWRNAVDLINQYFGGIQGHPLKLNICDFGATAQQGQVCGSRFANSSATKAVLFTGGNTGATQLVAANNASKVYFCTVGGPGYTAAKNMFCTQSGALAVSDIATYLKQYKHAKSVSILSLQSPAIEDIVDSQKPVYSQLGITVTTAFSAPGATDVTSTLVAGQVQSTDATVLIAPLDSMCPPYVTGLKTLGVKKPVVSLTTCIDPSVVKAVGTPNFTFLEYGPSPDVKDPTGQTQVFKDANKAYGNANGPNAYQAFGTVLLMAKIMNKLGVKHLTTAAIAARMRAYTGALFLGDPSLKFGKQPFPSVGSLRARFFTHNPNGTWTDATGGKWVS